MLSNCKVIALVADDFEDLELWVPVMRLREEHAQVDLAGEQANHLYHGKYGVPAQSTHSFLDIDYTQYDGILVPGGWAPDKLRRYPRVLEMVRYFNEKKLPIGEICHAGWVLISAGILDGINVTSTPGIKDDMTNAKAIWHDVSAITDGHIVSAQRPVDIPNYNRLLVEAFKKVNK